MNAIAGTLNVWGLRFAGFALPMLLQSAVLIALLFGLDFALRKKVRATIRYAVWLLALVKLALPPSLASPTAAAYWMPVPTTGGFSLPAPAPAALAKQDAGHHPARPSKTLRELSAANSGSPGLTWEAELFVAWLSVAMGVGVWVLWRLRVVMEVLQESTIAPESAQVLLETCRRQLGIRGVIPLRCAAIGSPAICGFFRPIILIPPGLAENLREAEMRSVLLHELAHFKRGDLWINHAQILLQIVYWYNPLLWLANAIIRRTREQAVDEMVLVEMGAEAETYPATLLRVAKFGLGRSLAAVGLMGILEPAGGLTDRILQIMKRPLPDTARLGAQGLITVLLVALVAVPMACRRKSEPLTAQNEGPPEGDSKFVTTASLGACLSNGKAVFHFKGKVDGSDSILITRDGARWSHSRRHWPLESVSVNNTLWNTMERNYLTTAGPEKFLPETFSLEAVDLEVIEGRDVVAIERTNRGLIVYLDDTPGGASDYDFKLNFHPVGSNPPSARQSPAARLKISAQVSGSDCIKITASEAALDHKSYLLPSEVTINGLPWDVGRTNVLKNEGATRFLPDGVDFSTARIISRQGRDLATAWGEKDALWVRFADNPNGSSPYEIEIAFGPE